MGTHGEEHRQAERESVLSDARYRAFISQSSEGIWRFECEQPIPIGLPEDQQIDAFYRFNYLAECNDAMARMYGYDHSQELIGKKLGELLIRSALQNDEFHRLFVRSGYRLTDAESHELDRHGKPRFFLNNQVGIIEKNCLVRIWGTQRDITPMKVALDALRESEQRFALFMQYLPGAAFIKDADGRVVFVNEAHKRIMGWTGDEWKGKKSAELFPPDVAAQFEAHDRRVLETGEPLKVIEPIPHPDGYHQYLVSKFPIATGPGAPPMLGGMAIDFTDLRRSEETVRYQKTLLESLIEASLDGVLLVSPEGKWLSFNRRFIEMWGIPPEVVGTGSDEHALRAVRDKLKDPDEFLNRVNELYRHSQESEVNERIELKDGRIFSRNSSPVRSADGTHYGRVWFLRDSTEEEHARDRLRSLASELTLSEEKERRRIARMLHDDIAQLLAISEARLHLVARSAHNPANITEVIRTLQDASEHTRSLTVELSPPILYEKGLVAAIAWLVERTGTRHGLQLSFQDDGQTKSLDEQAAVLLFQATRELMSNMVKHAKATRGAVSLSRVGGELRIIVEDNSIGFDSSAVQQRPEKSDCFGLFSIRERLKYLGGRAEWESHPGQGTRFTLIAPLRDL